ncbi:hypothetical protein BLOT_001450 [Blomia tropicalis]|nr:hypothetical protein BLOT_001450 [Blomia tropicalis]
MIIVNLYVQVHQMNDHSNGSGRDHKTPLLGYHVLFYRKRPICELWFGLMWLAVLINHMHKTTASSPSSSSSTTSRTYGRDDGATTGYKLIIQRWLSATGLDRLSSHI